MRGKRSKKQRRPIPSGATRLYRGQPRAAVVCVQLTGLLQPKRSGDLRVVANRAVKETVA